VTRVIVPTQLRGYTAGAGEVTATARGFAAQHGIRLLEGAELAKLLPRRGA